MPGRYLGWLLLLAGFHSTWRIAASYPQVSTSDLLYIAATYFLIIPIWTYAVFNGEGAHVWAKISILLGLVGLGPLFLFSAAGLWLSRHVRLPAHDAVAGHAQSGKGQDARGHRLGGQWTLSQLVRWSGLALALGSLSYILLDFRSLFPANIYYTAAQFAASGCLSIGFIGMHIVQAKPPGHLGWTALVTLVTGLLLQAADMAYWFFRPGSQLYPLVYEVGGICIIIGLLALGIAMSRGNVFSSYFGFGLIVADLLGVLYGSRIPVAVFLLVLAIVLSMRKLASPQPAHRDTVKANG